MLHFFWKYRLKKKKYASAARLEDQTYFGPLQTPARLFCFTQYFNNFSLISVQINDLNWIA